MLEVVVPASYSGQRAERCSRLWRYEVDGPDLTTIQGIIEVEALRAAQLEECAALLLCMKLAERRLAFGGAPPCEVAELALVEGREVGLLKGR